MITMAGETPDLQTKFRPDGSLRESEPGTNWVILEEKGVQIQDRTHRNGNLKDQRD